MACEHSFSVSLYNDTIIFFHANVDVYGNRDTKAIIDGVATSKHRTPQTPTFLDLRYACTVLKIVSFLSGFYLDFPSIFSIFSNKQNINEQ